MTPKSQGRNRNSLLQQATKKKKGLNRKKRNPIRKLPRQMYTAVTKSWLTNLGCRHPHPHPNPKRKNHQRMKFTGRKTWGRNKATTIRGHQTTNTHTHMQVIILYIFIICFIWNLIFKILSDWLLRVYYV